MACSGITCSTRLLQAGEADATMVGREAQGGDGEGSTGGMTESELEKHQAVSILGGFKKDKPDVKICTCLAGMFFVWTVG